jgi:hypothetical protein
MKTPIEWFYETIINDPLGDWEYYFKKSKEIEKQQIELAFLMGKHNGIQICQYNSKAKEIEAEQYYNETYKNETT